LRHHVGDRPAARERGHLHRRLRRDRRAVDGEDPDLPLHARRHARVEPVQRCPRARVRLDGRQPVARAEGLLPAAPRPDLEPRVRRAGLPRRALARGRAPVRLRHQPGLGGAAAARLGAAHPPGRDRHRSRGRGVHGEVPRRRLRAALARADPALREPRRLRALVRPREPALALRHQPCHVVPRGLPLVPARHGLPPDVAGRGPARGGAPDLPGRDARVPEERARVRGLHLMRVSAYVLLADPSFLAASLSAYYHLVYRVVLSYDETRTSWTGTPLPVDECLAIVETIDTDGKCVRAPGRFARLDEHPLDNDTHQRQSALDAASDGADWVLQLDTDEVMLDPDAFLASLDRAERAGAGGLHFPSRWLYSRVAPGRYLEASTRLGRPAASYPGPLAVRAGTTLTHARQADVPLWRVDLRPWNTDPSHRHDAVVHEVVR